MINDNDIPVIFNDILMTLHDYYREVNNERISRPYEQYKNYAKKLYAFKNLELRYSLSFTL